MSQPDELVGFVPIAAEALRTLEEAATALARARHELDLAANNLVELADDMKIDAVRRLAERGASAAQIARYEDAFHESAGALKTRRAALEAACASMQAAVDHMGRSAA